MAIMRYPDVAVLPSGDGNSTLIHPRVTFTPYTWKAAKPLLTDTKMTMGGTGDSVCLYLPNGFTEKYTANWNETEIVTSMLGADINAGSGGIMSAATGIVGGAVKGFDAGTIGTDAIAAAVKAGQSSVGGIMNSVLYSSGLTPFPGQFNMFNKADPINMDFTFDMVPRNKREADSIVNICTHFKDKILPTYAASGSVSQYMLTFPDIWRISFTGINGVGYTGTSQKSTYPDMALVSCNVGYGGGANSALTFHDGNPVVITLSLGFKAIKPSYKNV